MDEKLFWRMYEKTKVLDNGCVEWMGPMHKHITPILGGSKFFICRRVLWEAFVEPITYKDKIRAPICGNNRCINITHFNNVDPTTYYAKDANAYKELFYSKTILDKQTGCLLWNGIFDDYGSFLMNGKLLQAHRVAYEFEHGKIPDKMLIRHMCHNKKCVNTEHLTIGTNKDNSIDSVLSGTSSAILNQEQVLETIKLRNDGLKISTIANNFGVTYGAIYSILTGISWSYITGITPKIKESSLESYRDAIYSRTKTLDNGCIIWKGQTNGGRYGKFQINRKHMAVHRITYELEYGKIPDGLLIRHQCRSKLCVNPKHLMIGTSSDNQHDTLKDGTNKFATLTIKDAREIRIMLKDGISQKDIAEKYGVSKRSIYRIKYNLTWKID